MLDNKGFDLWADTYEKTVKSSDKEDVYPFAGYKTLMNKVYNIILSNNGNNILDIGIGTGILCEKLYREGFSITGIDFSDEMLKICRAKMPTAKIIQYDFTKGFPESIKNDSFDHIICTYAIHHIEDDAKIRFIKELVKILKSNGSLIIGDIGFTTKDELEECKRLHEDEWDNDEHYFIYDEIKSKIPDEYKIMYEQISFCAGVMKIEK